MHVCAALTLSGVCCPAFSFFTSKLAWSVDTFAPCNDCLTFGVPTPQVIPRTSGFFTQFIYTGPLQTQSCVLTLGMNTTTCIDVSAGTLRALMSDVTYCDAVGQWKAVLPFTDQSFVLSCVVHSKRWKWRFSDM